MNTQDKEDLKDMIEYDPNALFAYNTTIDLCCEELSKYAFTSFEYSKLQKLKVKHD